MESARLESLVQRLRDGDTSVSEEIIEDHIGLAFSMLKRFKIKSNEDLRSAAMLGLCQAVQWAAEGRMTDNNIKPYICRTVCRFIEEQLKLYPIIAIDRRVATRINIKPLVYAIYEHYNDQHDDYKPKRQDPTGPTTEDEYFYDTIDFFKSLHLSYKQAKVVYYLQLGLTVKEIASRFECSDKYIYQLIAEIRERIKQSDLWYRLGWGDN